MFQKTAPFVLQTIIAAIVVGTIHYLLLRFTDLTYNVPKLLQAYAFIVFIHLSSYVITARTSLRHFDKTAFVFSGLTFLKMILTVVYLWPLIREGGPGSAGQLLQFFTVYFIFLFMEARAVFRLLNK